MTLFFADLVRVTSEGTGTGDLVLGDALPGHRGFDAVPPGARFHYAILGVTHPDQWETGEGEIGSGGALVRLPLSSSADNGLVDFPAGLKTVALTVAAAWFSGREAAAGPVGIEDVVGLQVLLDDKAALAGADFTGPVSAPALGAAGDADVSGVYRVDGVKVVGNRVTGWAVPGGTASRASYETGTVTVFQLAQRVKALIQDLTDHGLIGGG
ncbi:MAG TPA: hypothetical protein VMS43_13095 [Allosphingosinicella sp.]|nr:hypothetical protein [Allosphingosinicella sp.]